MTNQHLPRLQRPPRAAALALGLALAGLVPLPLPAQSLPDPTRPMGTARSLTATPAAPAGPAGLTPNPVPRAGASTARAPARVVPPPRLQALMSPDGGPRSAMLDGVVLTTGQSLGTDWRVERIGDDGVLLRRATPDTATLWLPLLGDARPHKEP
ncbi:hypothetical protein [Leptothrix discophora]|uniref:MSHA biogenesis protein MshK n=1 Tax=Leptothrix discophora TaxID=89 RepID=A0ABT9G7Y6_LEPDI|nr:hypothetical protein [Leptothrix discophora]MDP4302599.1 hypothetical protein [Leptothrix discophora]